MKRKIDPKESRREEAYHLWMKSPMPMVTLTKTFDITKIYKNLTKKMSNVFVLHFFATEQ